MKGCRRCLTDASSVVSREGEVRRLARLMARTTRPDRMEGLKADLAIAKANLAQSKQAVEAGHDCDTRLTDEHWSKAQRA